MSSSTAWNALGSIVAYSVCSNGMIMSNKLLVSTFEYKFNFSILLVQSLCSVLVLLTARALGWIQFRNPDRAKIAAWIPVNLFFVAMLYTSFQGLHYLAVPMVTIFKNLTNVGIAFGAWYLFGESLSYQLLLALGLVLAGALLSAFNDLEFDLVGYLWMLANCGTTAAFVLYMRAAVKFPMTSWDKAFYNNLLSIPVALFFAAATGELPGAAQAWQWGEPNFVLAITFSGCVGVFLSLASLWCVEATGATTYSMVGALNKIPLAIASIFLFGTQVTFQSAVFITFGLLGGAVFAYVKAREQQARSRRAEAEKGEQGEIDPKTTHTHPENGGAKADVLDRPGDEDRKQQEA